jgi:glycosyltransferase involved in cell wall biosynthesis
MKLTVLNVAFPFARVAPDAVGGAEQVLGWLDGALARAGHRSVIVAQAGSQVHGRLIGTHVPPGPLTPDLRRAVWAAHRDNIVRAIARFEPDVVHMHGIDFADYLPPPADVPILVTLHLPPSWYPARVFDLPRDDVHLHCVSRSQHAQCPRGARLLPPIPNGVPVRERPTRARRHRFALALGRICTEKNWHAALDAGRAAGMPVVLAGQVFPYDAHRRYFDKEIEPRLQGMHRFIGPIGPQAKHRLLTRAQCVLVPSLAPETSSLVAMEALACGTPVVAWRSGALPEIVEHGVTGFLVETPQQMADAITRCATLDRARCHAIARERFGLPRMLEQYLDVYRQLATDTADLA